MSSIPAIATNDDDLFKEYDWELCKKAIRQCYSDIVKGLDSVQDIVDELAGMLSLGSVEELRGLTGQVAARKLLDTLYKSHLATFKVFIKALKTTSQGHLVSIIKDMCQRLKGSPQTGRAEATSGALVSGASATRHSPVDTDSKTMTRPDGLLPASKDRPGTLHLALLPFMSALHTHLEVRALCHNNHEQLKSWIELHKVKELSEPETHWIMDNCIAVGDKLRVDVDSIIGDDEYVHGCKLVRPSSLVSGPDDTYTWLVDLAGTSMSPKRKFKLHIFAEAASRLRYCGTVKFCDFNGSSRLPSLGFSSCNQMTKTNIATNSHFARHESYGGVYHTAVARQVINLGDSVGALLTMEKLVGTGFCVGSDFEKFIITCHHVWPCEVKPNELFITFDDSTTSCKPIAITGVVHRNEELDFLILSVDQPAGQLPPPIKGSCFKFEDEVLDQTASSRFFTIIGFPVKTANNRAIDFVANWSQLDLISLSGAKEEVSRLWKDDQRLRGFLAEYDEMMKVGENHLLYNISAHQHGSSGSPVLYCRHNQLNLVAMHRRGLPSFYYEIGNSDVPEKLHANFTVEAGTRMSSIYNSLENNRLQSLIFQ